jgi:hypothetical protein
VENKVFITLITEMKYDENGALISIEHRIADSCACSLEGIKNPLFDRHSEFECYNKEGGILKA